MSISPEELIPILSQNGTSWLTTAYGIMGALGIAAFIPQIIALLHDKSGSKNVPLTTWVLWGAQTFVYFLYALLVNKDPMFITLTLLSLLATHACLYLLVYNRFIRKPELNRRADDLPAEAASAKTPADAAPAPATPTVVAPAPQTTSHPRAKRK